VAKERAVVVGNCQASALELLLNQSSNFLRHFEMQEVPAVHLMSASDVTHLQQSLKSTRLLIVQQISADYRDNIGLGTADLQSRLPAEGQSLTYPSIFWPAYSPELFYMNSADSAHFTEDFDYHHRLIFRGYLEQLTPFETLTNLIDTSYVDADPRSAEIACAELERRETDLDIRVSGFISQHFQDRRLFHTINHPSNECLLDVVRQILNQLDLACDVPLRQPGEILGQTTYPILPSVQSALGLKFESDFLFKIRDKQMHPIDVIDGYYRLYQSNPEIVESNRAQVNTDAFLRRGKRHE
jgi:hypothetical protein